MTDINPLHWSDALMSTNGKLLRVVVIGLLLVVGSAAGAYGDWINWHPMDALMVTLGAIGLLLVAVALRVIRNRITRRVAVVFAALGLGVIAGQILGPSRPFLIQGEGTATVTLDSPTTATGTHIATCATVPDGTELQVSVDQNLRLDVVADDPSVPADIDQREFFGASITVGDRWRDGGLSRSDDIDLLVLISFALADTPETWMVATDASDLDIKWTNAGGTLHFAGLTQGTDYPTSSGAPIDIRGTITWTC